MSSSYTSRPRNPRSEIQIVGGNNEQIQKRLRNGLVVRAVSTPYPCPVCNRKMYKDEDIEFGTITLPGGGRHTGKHHKVCPKDEGVSPR
jgi:hypothetical protein